jgi:hypothetical protein
VAKLLSTAMASLDGDVADASGAFEWAAPDAEVHAFVNDLERPIGTSRYGRRRYETMVAWETVPTGADQPAVARDFAALWRAAEKVVDSTTLPTVASARTQIERRFDPEAIRRRKAGAGRDLSVGGPTLAAQALRAGGGRVPAVPRAGRGGRRHAGLAP